MAVLGGKGLFCLAIAAVVVLAVVLPRHVPTSKAYRSVPPSYDIESSLRRADKWATSIEEAEARGKELYELMGKPSTVDDGLEDSKWTSYSMLGEYGWSILNPKTRQGERKLDISAFGNVDDALHTMTPNTDTEVTKPITSVPWSQGSGGRVKDLGEFKINGRAYQKTGAEYENMYSPELGLIIAEGVYSPRTRAKINGVPTDRIAPSPHWSDVAYLTWAKLCDEQKTRMQNIKYIMHTHVDAIAEGDTGSLLRELHPLPYRWPEKFADAHELKPGSHEFNVVLGSSSGYGTAYFFLQHKRELGATRHVVSLKVWQPAGESAPSILLEISDAGGS